MEKQRQPANEKLASDANFLMGTCAVVKTLMVRMDFEMRLSLRGGRTGRFRREQMPDY